MPPLWVSFLTQVLPGLATGGAFIVVVWLISRLIELLGDGHWRISNSL